MRIVIERRDAIPQIVLNKLFSYTQLQDTVGVIMLALVNVSQGIDFKADA